MTTSLICSMDGQNSADTPKYEVPRGHTLEQQSILQTQQTFPDISRGEDSQQITLQSPNPTNPGDVFMLTQSNSRTNDSQAPTSKPLVDNALDISATQQTTLLSSVSAPIQPLSTPETEIATNDAPTTSTPSSTQKDVPQSSSQQIITQKAVITKVKLTDELNIFDWFRTTDIINQIAEKARNSVDTVITALDPGMKEYLYSGGNINIIVISDSETLVSPIRDAFQSVFGRATVVAARYNPPEAALDYPIKLACGFDEAIEVSRERIKKLRLDTSNVPQNQVVVAIQPTLVNLIDPKTSDQHVTNGLNSIENHLPEWFLTYSMIIEDPILGSTMKSYSQFIPIDTETVAIAKGVKFPDNFTNCHLGFAISINELMNAKLKLTPDDSDDQGCKWLQVWSGLNEIQIIHGLSVSLAHLYRNKWNDCVVR